MPKLSQYVEGYQEALRDIQTALNDGGEALARTWVDNNLMESYKNDLEVTITHLCTRCHTAKRFDELESNSGYCDECIIANDY